MNLNLFNILGQINTHQLSIKYFAFQRRYQYHRIPTSTRHIFASHSPTNLTSNLTTNQASNPTTLNTTIIINHHPNPSSSPSPSSTTMKLFSPSLITITTNPIRTLTLTTTTRKLSMSTLLTPDFSSTYSPAKAQKDLSPLLKSNGGKWTLIESGKGIERGFRFRGFKRCWVCFSSFLLFLVRLV